MIRIASLRIPSLALLALLASGCLNDSHVVAPDPAALVPQDLSKGRPDQGTFPLAVGNRWVFRTHQLSRLSVNGGPLEVVQDVAWRTTRELFCEQVQGQDLLVNVAEAVQLPNGANFSIWRYRQNRHGLWISTGAAPPPAGCEPPFLMTEARPLSVMPVPGVEALRRDPRQSVEKHLLVYPLHVGRTWLMEGKGSTRCTVEAYEQLDLPIGSEFAFRIRLDRPGQEPGSGPAVWYGKSGYLQTQFHGESTRTLPDGTTQHTVSDYTEVVQAVQLVEPGSSTAIRALAGSSR